jgi:hypothetical protein
MAWEYLNCALAAGCDALGSDPCGPVYDFLADVCGAPSPSPFELLVPEVMPPPDVDGAFCAEESVTEGPNVPCDHLFDSCNDGRQYRVSCFQSSDTIACSCIIDGLVQGGFLGAECPLDIDIINDGCGFDRVH